jgi:hypothetical protein
VFFSHENNEAVTGKKCKLPIREGTAFKGQKTGSTHGLFPDFTGNTKGRKHGKQLTTGKNRKTIAITYICMFDQLKRIDHDILFSSEAILYYSRRSLV